MVNRNLINVMYQYRCYSQGYNPQSLRIHFQWQGKENSNWGDKHSWQTFHMLNKLYEDFFHTFWQLNVGSFLISYRSILCGFIKHQPIPICAQRWVNISARIIWYNLHIPRFPPWWGTFSTWQLCSTGHDVKERNANQIKLIQKYNFCTLQIIHDVIFAVASTQ